MWIPDTWEVEVLVPLLEVVELDVLDVLEVLKVLDVLKVAEDVDVWTKRIGCTVYMTHGSSKKNHAHGEISNGVLKKVMTHAIFLIVHENPSGPRWYSRTLAEVLWKWQHNLRTLHPFTTDNQQPNLLHSWFTMWIPDTWEVEVLVPLLEVVELDVLEVLELDVPEVLEVVEDVDVWTKQMLVTWHACWSRVLRVFGYSLRNPWNMHSWLWESLEDLPVKSTEKYSLHIFKCYRNQWWNLAIAINMFEHICPMHLSGLVMSYAALTFSIDPQIHTKDNDTFFQVCPRGVQFKVAINIQIMFVSHYQEVQTLFVYKPAG